MTDRDYERMERRKKLHEKSLITSIIAGVVIVAALIAIIFVVVALVSKHQPEAQPVSTEAATEQPTLYRPTEQPATASPTDTVQAPTAAAYSTEAQPLTEAPAATSQQEQGTATPAEQGALYYYANGSTSYGYDWTYSGGGGVVSVSCTYDFSSAQYNFLLTGVAPGTAQLSLVYYTADDQPVTVPMTVSVDENLKVTRVG